MIFDNILQSIGKMPIVLFQHIGKTLPYEPYGKCEFLNPGGSVKDRIDAAMVERKPRKKKEGLNLAIR